MQCVPSPTGQTPEPERRTSRRVGCPHFASKQRAQHRVRCMTGAMRLEADRRHLTLPVIGTLGAKAHTRRIERHVASGNARILSRTLSKRWGRRFVSAQYALRTKVPTPTGTAPHTPTTRAGVDVGPRVLATIADTDGNVIEVPNRKAPSGHPRRAAQDRKSTLPAHPRIART